jgi:hypothetical protein
MTIRCYDCTHPKHVHKEGSPPCAVLGCACKAFSLKKPFGTGTFVPTERML